MVDHLLGQPTPTTPLRPKIYLDAKDHQEANTFLNRKGLSHQRPIIALFPTMRQSAQSWPDEYYAKLCDRLDQIGCQIVLNGSQSDKARLTTIAEHCHTASPIIAAGDLSLRSLCAFLSYCELAVTTDSGGRHIANAAGIPVFFFRNLQSFELETGVYGDTEYDLLPPSELLSKSDQQKQLRALSPESVYNRLAPLLTPNPERVTFDSNHHP